MIAMSWTIDQNIASFQVGGYFGTFDITRPDCGLCVSRAGGDAARYLAVQFAEPSRVRITDCYTRIDDLILAYPQTAQRPFNVQLQYRLFAGGDLDTRFPSVLAPAQQLMSETDQAILIELWISNYTFSLDTHPEIETECFSLASGQAASLQLFDPGDDGVGLSPCPTKGADGMSIAAATRAAGSHHSGGVAVMVHPSDQIDTQLTISGSPLDNMDAAAIKLRMFGRFMEKGVIRRARLRMLLSSAPIDDFVLNAHYREFAVSPLPLTT